MMLETHPFLTEFCLQNQLVPIGAFGILSEISCERKIKVPKFLDALFEVC